MGGATRPNFRPSPGLRPPSPRCRGARGLSRRSSSRPRSSRTSSTRGATYNPRVLSEEVSESELVRVRREKLARIAALGYDPFPTTADVDATVADVVARYGGKSHDELEAEKPRVKIAGRILTIREFGKTSFLVLSEKTSRIH